MQNWPKNANNDYLEYVAFEWFFISWWKNNYCSIDIIKAKTKQRKTNNKYSLIMNVLYKYRMLHLSFLRSQQLYHSESLHLVVCPLSAAVLTDMTKETLCSFFCTLHLPCIPHVGRGKELLVCGMLLLLPPLSNTWLEGGILFSTPSAHMK